MTLGSRATKMRPDELSVPERVSTSERAMEMARIWIADGKQVIALSPNLWSDPGNWGLMLVDVARQLSRQYADAGWKEEDVLLRIRAAFDAEWRSPTT